MIACYKRSKNHQKIRAKEERSTVLKEKLLRKQTFFSKLLSVSILDNKYYVDHRKTSYYLRTGFQSTSTKMNSRKDQNVAHGLDLFLCSDGDNWEEHSAKFMVNFSQVASRSKEFSKQGRLLG